MSRSEIHFPRCPTSGVSEFCWLDNIDCVQRCTRREQLHIAAAATAVSCRPGSSLASARLLCWQPMVLQDCMCKVLVGVRLQLQQRHVACAWAYLHVVCWSRVLNMKQHNTVCYVVGPSSRVAVHETRGSMVWPVLAASAWSAGGTAHGYNTCTGQMLMQPYIMVVVVGVVG